MGGGGGGGLRWGGFGLGGGQALWEALLQDNGGGIGSAKQTTDRGEWEREGKESPRVKG
jgi:hypothetical protein